MKEIVLAGSGGQGVLTVGLIIAEIAVGKGRRVTWLPSYGSAMRGGTANCTVKYSDDFIENPAIEEIDVLMALNAPSYEMFRAQVKPDGLILTDRAVLSVQPESQLNAKVIGLACGALAESIGHPKGANIIMTGALIKLMGDFSASESIEAMNKMFAKKGKNAFADLNAKAFEAGYQAV